MVACFSVNMQGKKYYLNFFLETNKEKETSKQVDKSILILTALQLIQLQGFLWVKIFLHLITPPNNQTANISTGLINHPFPALSRPFLSVSCSSNGNAKPICHGVRETSPTQHLAVWQLPRQLVCRLWSRLCFCHIPRLGDGTALSPHKPLWMPRNHYVCVYQSAPA